MSIKILVVEDEGLLQNAIKAKLGSEGFEVFTAQKVDEAYECLVENPDVKAIWLDHYLLGEESGLDLVAMLKKEERFSKIPIYIVSNTATHEKINSYIELGIEKYYTKANTTLAEVIADIKEKLLKV